MIILLFNLLNAPQKTQEELIFSEFLTKLEANQIDEVTIKENSITGRFKDGQSSDRIHPNTRN
jgi:cell division protease FtsH